MVALKNFLQRHRYITAAFNICNRRRDTALLAATLIGAVAQRRGLLPVGLPPAESALIIREMARSLFWYADGGYGEGSAAITVAGYIYGIGTMLASVWAPANVDMAQFYNSGLMPMKNYVPLAIAAVCAAEVNRHYFGVSGKEMLELYSQKLFNYPAKKDRRIVSVKTPAPP